MFLIRQAKAQDLDALHALAKQTFFINLPPDRDLIGQKIEQSKESFHRLATGKAAAVGRGRGSSHGAGIRALTGSTDLFLFVLEDVAGRGVIGTSQVVAQMGGEGHPRVFLRMGRMNRRSDTLKLSWEHDIVTLETDASGPSEVGGLILNNAFRGHAEGLGKFLSSIRFHLIGLFRERFSATVVAEMLGPIDKNGYNPFFEKFTRHYIPRSFAEVYRFSQTSKEFVTGLLPSGPIDISIMDPDVAHAAGAVGPDTEPARRMLEDLGFRFEGAIDPLDGGPHLSAQTSEISLVRETRRVSAVAPKAEGGERAIVSTLNAMGEFVAVQTRATISGDTAGVLPEHAALLLPAPLAAGMTPTSAASPKK